MPKEAGIRTRVLFVTREPLLHHVGGSTTYALNFMEWLVRNGCDVTVLSTLPQGRSPRVWLRVKRELPSGVRLQVPGMWKLGSFYVRPWSLRAWVRLLLRAAARVPWLHGPAHWLAAPFGDRLTDVTWDVSAPTAGERALVLCAVAESAPQTVIGNYAYWGAMFGEPALQDVPRVLLLHDLLAARVERFRAVYLPLDTIAMDAAIEFAWMSAASCILAAQSREADVVAEHVKATVLVQPVVFAAEPLEDQMQPGRVLLVGANIPPNRDGLEWLLGEVWPLVLSACPAATLAIAGTLGSAVAEIAKHRSVLRLGMIDSIAEEYARAAVCLVPLRVGTGIKMKLVEALAFGKAVVSTSVGAEGVEDWLDTAVAMADEAASFAGAIVRLLTDPAERQRCERAALLVAERHFSPRQPMSSEFAEAVVGRS